MKTDKEEDKETEIYMEKEKKKGEKLRTGEFSIDDEND